MELMMDRTKFNYPKGGFIPDFSVDSVDHSRPSASAAQRGPALAQQGWTFPSWIASLITKLGVSIVMGVPKKDGL